MSSFSWVDVLFASRLMPSGVSYHMAGRRGLWDRGPWGSTVNKPVGVGEGIVQMVTHWIGRSAGGRHIAAVRTAGAARCASVFPSSETLSPEDDPPTTSECMKAMANGNDKSPEPSPKPRKIIAILRIPKITAHGASPTGKQCTNRVCILIICCRTAGGGGCPVISLFFRIG